MKTIEASSEIAVEANTRTASPTTGSNGPVNVWLVDDDGTLRRMFAQLLERQGGIVCPRQFDSPNAVLSALASRPGPDVILLDIQMGAFNGLDAISAIKSLSRSTRVFMLTTFFDSGSIRRAMAAGASGCLLKTYSAERLADCIRSREEAVTVGCSPLSGTVGTRLETGSLQPQPLVDLRNDASEKQPQFDASEACKPLSVLQWLKRFARN